MKCLREVSGIRFGVGLLFSSLVLGAGCNSAPTSQNPVPQKSEQKPTPAESKSTERAPVDASKETIDSDKHENSHGKKESRSNELMNIPEEKRRQIFVAVVTLELEGMTCPEACVFVSKQYGITADTAFKISQEGTGKGWPKP
jgi:hypothetical protein